MPKFNGHKNWNHWNVSLWINNDEGLYRLAQQCIRDSQSRVSSDRSRAVELFLDRVGATQTPDNAPYTASSVRAAMVGMDH
jgi:hypothetical protein